MKGKEKHSTLCPRSDGYTDCHCSNPMPTNTPIEKEIEDRIEKIVASVNSVEFLHGVPVSLPSATIELLRSGIRNALRSLLSQHTEAVVKELEGMKKLAQKHPMLDCKGKPSFDWNTAYENALDSTITKIKESTFIREAVKTYEETEA